MTTKAQERKAMEEIRRIVDGLGADSYIGTAMEGVWEIMLENIDNDFAISMKDRMEHLEREKETEIEGWKGRAYKAESDLKAANDNIESLCMKNGQCERELESTSKMLSDNRDAMSEMSNTISKLHGDNADLVCEIASLKEEIIHLKAKLYDMIELTERGVRV